MKLIGLSSAWEFGKAKMLINIWLTSLLHIMTFEISMQVYSITATKTRWIRYTWHLVFLHNLWIEIKIHLALKLYSCFFLGLLVGLLIYEKTAEKLCSRDQETSFIWF